MSNLQQFPSVRLVAARELAAILGVSLAAIRKMTRENRLPLMRIGRSVRFDPNEVILHFRS